MRPSLLAFAVVLAAAAGPAAAQTDAATDDLPVAEKLHGLSLLWSEAKYSFAYFDQVPDLDWDSTYRAFVPQVLDTRSTFDYYRVLERFLVTLRDGHTSVTMPRALRERSLLSYPWLLTRAVDGQVYVWNVGGALAERIPIGSVIDRVNGEPVRAYADREIVPYVAASTDHDRWERAARQMLHGPAGDSVRIGYVTPAGARRALALARDRRTREDAWVAPTEGPPRFALRWLDGGIAHVSVNTFNDDSVVIEFEAALPDLARARALVIDVRRNGGGNSAIADRIASRLTDDTLPTQRWRTRQHVAAFKAWGRSSERYRDYWIMDAWHDGGSHGDVAPADGLRVIRPTVVLQEHDTFSAAEDFLITVDALPHVTTMGRPSGGSTGQPLFLDLPGGGTARICTKRDTFPDGRDFVGIGIQPDIVVRTTVEDMRAGRDPVLDRAVAFLRERLTD
jgi:carboxyl-terminal processing protease